MSGGETGARIETYVMLVTWPTSHFERSEVNDVAPTNMNLRELERAAKSAGRQVLR